MKFQPLISTLGWKLFLSLILSAQKSEMIPQLTFPITLTYHKLDKFTVRQKLYTAYHTLRLLVDENYFLNTLGSLNFLGTLKKEQVNGFMSLSIPLNPSHSLMLPSKFQINSETEGILFEAQDSSGAAAFLFLDLSGKTLNFIDKVYFPFFKKNFINQSSITTKKQSAVASSGPNHNKWLDRSFSLSDWTNEDSIDEDSLKKNNKLVSKHVIQTSFFIHL